MKVIFLMNGLKAVHIGGSTAIMLEVDRTMKILREYKSSTLCKIFVVYQEHATNRFGGKLFGSPYKRLRNSWCAVPGQSVQFNIEA